MLGQIRALNWTAAAIAAALVVPVGGLSAAGADQYCNHLEGDIEVAERGAPRGAWCNAFQWDYHWLLLLVLPAVATLMLVLLIGRRPAAYASAWGAGAMLAWVPVMVMSSLRAYYEI